MTLELQFPDQAIVERTWSGPVWKATLRLDAMVLPIPMPRPFGQPTTATWFGV